MQASSLAADDQSGADELSPTGVDGSGTDGSRSSDPGDQPPSHRYFPGWTMVGVSAAAQFLSAPGQSYSVAAFKEPMRESLQISETNYSLAYAVATLVSVAILPFIGRIIDRVGARRTLPVIALLLGMACLLMSQVSSLLGLYVAFGCVRSLGQGALGLAAAWLVGEWFARRRGFATALSGYGGILSVMTIPLLNAYMISTFSWQTAWAVLGVSVWVVLMIPSLILVRDRPEEIGLLPDGDPSTPTASKLQPGAPSKKHKVAISSDGDWIVSSVMKDPTFWKLIAVPATSGMIGTGLIFHCVSLLGSRGVSDGWALSLISFQAVIASCVVLFMGWLTDRIQARYLLAAAMLLLAASGFTVLVMPDPRLALLYGVMMGLHGSILRSTGTVVSINYYGRTHQGAIRGIAMAVMVFAAAAGPLPLALSIDWFSTYDIALYGFIAIPLLSAALVSTAKPPRNQPDVATLVR